MRLLALFGQPKSIPFSVKHTGFSCYHEIKASNGTLVWERSFPKCLSQ